MNFCSLKAQDVTQEFGFLFDNDAIFFTDDYYSNGVAFSYAKKLDNSFIFLKTDANNLQLKVSLANHFYTPSRLKTSDVQTLDRPYAGWSFVRASIQNINRRSNHILAFETGITGQVSQSSNIHRWYHRVVGFTEPSWVDQIDFKWLFNLKYDYQYDIMVKEKHIFQGRFSSSIGTKDVYAEGSLNYIFGRFDRTINGARNNAIGIGTINELFFETSLGYRYVAHNTLIEGGLFKNTDSFTLNATNHIFLASAGSVYRLRKNTFKMKLFASSNETPKASWHFYMSLSYRRAF